ncbi:VOC family protein [Rhodococcus sp. NPDC058521]|uniref:VOC family protein n=1 Tax=Rhodococcus sp. NPDC058521 TaxID=3346536 RepID=UPI00365FFC78
MPAATQQTIVPNIWSNSVAEEQASFYADTFRDCSFEISARYPEHGLPEFQQGMAGKPVTVDISLAGTQLVLINAGPEFEPNPTVNLMLNFDPVLYEDASKYQDEVFAKLSDGGIVMMGLDAYPFSEKYAWVQDKFGVSWQLILTNPEGSPRPFVLPSLMFCGAAQNKCRQAVESYIDLFSNSGWGTVAEYPQPTGPAVAGSIMFSEFQLAGQWLTAMDSGADQPFDFGEGMSLMISADGQSEIDRYWSALSAVPEAEQCGWCKDSYGLSWQVVPANMDELMTRPNAYEHMMQMKKLEIDKF